VVNLYKYRKGSACLMLPFKRKRASTSPLPLSFVRPGEKKQQPLLDYCQQKSITVQNIKKNGGGLNVLAAVIAHIMGSGIYGLSREPAE
jgi:hypothetical protein